MSTPPAAPRQSHLSRCTECHAQVTLAPPPASCPACGGQLIPVPAQTADSAAQTDHRGIALPPRHAVGGIITPR